MPNDRRAYYPGRTNLAILNGDDDLSTWDEDELLEGRRKNKHGKFVGIKPKLVPTAIHNEIARRQMEQAVVEMRHSLVPAVRLLREVVENEEADYGYRIKAAQLIIERVMGKATERIQVEMAPPWAVALQALIEARGSTELEIGSDVDDADIVDEYDD